MPNKIFSYDKQYNKNICRGFCALKVTCLTPKKNNQESPLLGHRQIEMREFEQREDWNTI